VPIYVLVAGSDGVDGNSQAAGAIVDHTSYDRLVQLGIDPEDSLRRCDAAEALAALGAQIHTGPTGVNHADLIFLCRSQ
jgi:hydroxypyruvate reductase